MNTAEETHPATEETAALTGIEPTAKAEQRAPATPRPFINPYIAGTLLGLLLFASVLISGHGVGASAGMARLLAAVEDLVAPAHVDANPGLAEFAGGKQNPLNNWIVFQLFGTLIGGFVSGLLGRRLRVETQGGPQLSKRKRWAMAFIGGSLVGFGARLARGCTSGQALSGGMVLSAGSWAFMLAVFAGGYLLAYPVRRLWN